MRVAIWLIIFILSALSINFANAELGSSPTINITHKVDRIMNEQTGQLLLIADQFETEIDKWRFVVITICKSPRWQVH